MRAVAVVVFIVPLSGQLVVLEAGEMVPGLQLGHLEPTIWVVVVVGLVQLPPQDTTVV